MLIDQGRIAHLAWAMMQAVRARKRLTRQDIISAADQSTAGVVKPFSSLSIDEQENYIEAGIVTAFRNLAPLYKKGDYHKIVRIAESLYALQPKIDAVTSQKLIKQQYSTPLPLAARLGYFVRLGLCDTTVYISYPYIKAQDWYCFDPTAGNGLLSAFIPPKNLFLNEYDTERSYMLACQASGIVVRKGVESFLSVKGRSKVYDYDAFNESPYVEISNDVLPPHMAKRDAGRRRVFHAMLINPPFATIEERTVDGCPVRKAEHLVGLYALSLLRPSGKAALIVGGKTKYDKYGIVRSKSESPFLRYLYSHYNVIANVTFAGQTYAKQGARFPFRVFLINGVRKEPNRSALPPTRSEDKYYDNPATDFSVLDQYITPLITEYDTSDARNAELLYKRVDVRLVRALQEAMKLDIFGIPTSKHETKQHTI